jgi:hypothetical protein
MPRFHLHIRTPTGLIEDEEGLEFVDHAAAIVEAVRGARSLMIGELVGGTLCLDQSIEIHDAAGRHLTSVPFSDAVRLVAAAEHVREIGIADRTRL